jgi:hypothetical protein
MNSVTLIDYASRIDKKEHRRPQINRRRNLCNDSVKSDYKTLSLLCGLVVCFLLLGSIQRDLLLVVPPVVHLQSRPIPFLHVWSHGPYLTVIVRLLLLFLGS